MSKCREISTTAHAQWILRNPDFPLDNDAEQQQRSSVYDKCDDIEYLCHK